MPAFLVPLIWTTIGAGGTFAISRSLSGGNAPFQYGGPQGGAAPIVAGLSQRDLMLTGAATVLAIAAYKILKD